MEPRLFDAIDKRLPAFNRTIIEGLATEHLRSTTVMAHIERIIRCAQEKYPPGLEFVGSYRCSPIEEYNVITSERNSGGRAGSKRVFDMARSDVYLVKYQFKYNGENLYPCYLYLPFVDRGGLMYIAGKLWSVSPVLADKVFSIGEGNIFISMPRAPVTFHQVQHAIEIDGEKLSRHIPYSLLHNKRAKNTRSASIKVGSVMTTLAHYLFAKHGLVETFQKFTGIEPVIVDEREITEEKYPCDKWVQVKSTKIQPWTCRLGNYRSVATKITMLFPRDLFTPAMEQLAAGFFYVVDHFPDTTEVDHVYSTWDWKVKLGYILWGEESGQSKLIEDIETHLKSLDGYVDFDVRTKLAEAGVKCADIYDLFMYIIVNMKTMLLEGTGKTSSMYGKQLVVLRYILGDINNKIFEFLFKITSNTKKAMTRETLNDILSEHFKPKLIYRITSGKGHGEVSSVSNPGDNLFFKITSNLVRQSDTAGKGKGRDGRPVDPSMYLDVSIAEFGGYCILPKSSPIGDNKVGPFVQIDPVTGDLIRNPEFIPLLDPVQDQIKRQ